MVVDFEGEEVSEFLSFDFGWRDVEVVDGVHVIFVGHGC